MTIGLVDLLIEHAPDSVVRRGVRLNCARRLARERRGGEARQSAFVSDLRRRAIAEHVVAANEQHYEVPADLFRLVLGPRLKYSCCYWPSGRETLAEAENAMLELSCERAQVEDGMDVLDLGCGWGSLSLWMADHYPESRITSVSNSNSQREYIEEQARKRGLSNLKVITCDINDFKPEGQFDRVVSVEMFEHVRNHKKLFGQIHDWLKSGGKCFVHIFSHQSDTYLFEAHSAKDWMSRYFFSGGIMPSSSLLISAASGALDCEEKWYVNGNHYSKTLEAWLEKQDANRESVMQTFKECYGEDAKLWFQRWRIFYMACSELFAYNGGKEWPVMHYRFTKA